MKNNSIGSVNNQQIQIVLINQTEFIPLKPICTALGVSYTDEVYEVMDNDFVSDKYKLLEIVLNDKKIDSIAIPIKYMLGYIAIVSNKTTLEKEKYIESKRTILDMLYKHIFPNLS